MSAAKVCINDVSLRDGIQSESRLIPLSTRLAILEKLLDAGVSNIQVGSLVNPRRVPQMLDIEVFFERLPQRAGVCYSALVLNTKGLERFKQSPLKQVDLSLSCSDEHSRKNTGLSLAEARLQVLAMVTAAKHAQLTVRAGLQCVFGCHYQGLVPMSTVLDLVKDLVSAGCDSISLADSTGQALPETIKRVVEAVQEICGPKLILHLHDTLGLGVANFIAGYQAGVRSFDASLGGVGACPFIPGAAGNIAIEDIVYLLDRQGIDSGISLSKLLPAVEIMESALDYALPGKVHKLLRTLAKPSGFHQARQEGSYGANSLTKNPEQ
ncbi:MAG: hydroxymethylglutaryl-CoA lyase [Proteobacteria bacterium]|nr:hydroxymethylglutaryl-CoA lyase [Pseudomonadota bacterium]